VEPQRNAPFALILTVLPILPQTTREGQDGGSRFDLSKCRLRRRDERMHLLLIFHARRVFHAASDIDAIGPDRTNRLGHVFRSQPAGENQRDA